ncbi:MAG: hypothetical protein HYT77_04895 [Deltaproteobacteria bacterium]|nr:hypothetical protein [Deltaproteobacteria bacterium]
MQNINNERNFTPHVVASPLIGGFLTNLLFDRLQQRVVNNHLGPYYGMTHLFDFVFPYSYDARFRGPFRALGNIVPRLHSPLDSSNVFRWIAKLDTAEELHKALVQGGKHRPPLLESLKATIGKLDRLNGQRMVAAIVIGSAIGMVYPLMKAAYHLSHDSPSYAGEVLMLDFGMLMYANIAAIGTTAVFFLVKPLQRFSGISLLAGMAAAWGVNKVRESGFFFVPDKGQEKGHILWEIAKEKLEKHSLSH